ncbi:hypothetical protein [Alkalimarinus sediminis]|uniref:hypothetical protein n=1 Tax=Alkalimarinus sediminis TaxID=1632866 RepID=UPI0020440BFC|nr:hypothetical protein [Alkalimarinus sediminis]
MVTAINVKSSPYIVGEPTIKKQGGWKSDATVWGYIDEGRLFTDNVTHTLIDRISELIGRPK